MLSLSAGALCSHRLLLHNERVEHVSMTAKGRRQAPQIMVPFLGEQSRAVLLPVQQPRQPRQRPQPRARQGRCAAASSRTGSGSAASSGELLLQVHVQEQQGAGKRPTEVPDYDASQLLLNLGLPTSGADKLRQAIAKLHVVRQHGVVQHSSQVAAHLHSLGVGQQQVARLVQHCPELFSWPAEERAAVLFGQLQQLGLTAAEAGNCFEKQPNAASTPSFQSAISVLAALYEAAGDKGGKGGESGGRRLVLLLRRQPSTVTLLTAKADTLQHRIANLRRLGLSGAQMVAGLAQAWRLLSMSPDHLGKRQELLRQELGVGSKQFAKILHLAPRVLTSSEETLRQRCQALVAVFGGKAALGMLDSSPTLLKIDSPIWQAALEVMRLVGVADPEAVAQRNAQVVCINWLEPHKLVNRLALQRCFGLTPAAVYQQHAGYAAKTGTNRLVCRLLYLEHCGLLPLVEDKVVRLRTWRREHKLDARCTSPREPALISLCDVCILSDPAFLVLLTKNSCDSGFAAFQAGLEALPAWQQLWAAAEGEAARLRAALPPELAEALAGAAKEAAEDGTE